MLEMGVAPDYVLDRMEMYEVTALLEHRHLRYKDSWERTRLSAFINARCAGAKIEEPKKLFSFSWEEDKSRKIATAPASEADQARLSATARYLLENGLMD